MYRSNFGCGLVLFSPHFIQGLCCKERRTASGRIETGRQDNSPTAEDIWPLSPELTLVIEILYSNFRCRGSYSIEKAGSVSLELEEA